MHRRFPTDRDSGDANIDELNMAYEVQHFASDDQVVQAVYNLFDAGLVVPL